MKTLIVGGRGMLGQAFVRLLEKKSWPYACWDREELDITNARHVAERIFAWKPELLINAAAYNAVDKAEDEPDVATLLNGAAVGHLRDAAEKCGAVFVHYSTDYVFDGKNIEGYTEDAEAHPLSIYGKSKRAGEEIVCQSSGQWYLIRTSRLFGPPGTSDGSKRSFPAVMIAIAREKGKVSAISADVSSPTFVDDLAAATLEIIETGLPSGIYHRTNSGSCTWHGYAAAALAAVGVDVPVEAMGPDAFPRKAARPAYSILRTTKLPPLRPWRDALDEFLKNG